MLKIKVALMLCAWLLACSVSSAQVKIVGGDGATLEDLMREKTFVTVVLKDPTARQWNLRITGIYEETITFITSESLNAPYPLSKVQEIRVQEGRMSRIRTRASKNALTDVEAKVVQRAAERALEIFDRSKGDQQIRMSAALVLSVSLHEKKEDALKYLQELAAGNDVPTAMAATTFLFLAGLPPDPMVIRAGFESGSRQAKASAARLTGLTNNKTYLPEVRTMLQDSTIEIFPAAAKAIGRMEVRSDLPELYDALMALTEAKGEAAVFALSQMGGEEVHQKMLDMLETTRGVEWFRVLRVLFALDDPRAKQIMKEVALLQPAYRREAGLRITASGDWDGKVFLREYLKKAEDPNMENLIYRARVATTLFMAGDLLAKSHLQRLVNTKPSEVYAKGRTSDNTYKKRAAIAVQLKTLSLIAGTGSRDLLTLLEGPVESAEAQVAIAACTAAMAIGNPEFGLRLRDIRL